MRNLKNILLGSTLVGSMGLTCGNLKESQEVIYNPEKTFHSFGTYRGVNERCCFDGSITSGDFDGDGDIDIAIYSRDNLVLYENKMPQKGRTTTK